MRRLTFLTVAASIFMLWACDDDGPRNTVELEDPWLTDRTPKEFRVDGQVGISNITDDWRDSSKGEISVTLVTGALDMSSVEIMDIAFQQGTSASVGVGSKLDLTGGQDTFTVTSANGDTRTYTVTYFEFEEELEGVWKLYPVHIMDTPGGVVVEGGVSGNGVWMTLQDKSWNWSQSPDIMNAYEIKFELLSVDEESGNTGGQVTVTPGDEGYFDYLWNSLGESFADKYELIPRGTSDFVKDITAGTIDFYGPSGELLSSVTILDEGGSGIYNDHENSDNVSEFTVPAGAIALHKPIEGGGWWNGPSDDYYNDVSRFVYNTRRVIWVIQKQ